MLSTLRKTLMVLFVLVGATMVMAACGGDDEAEEDGREDEQEVHQIQWCQQQQEPQRKLRCMGTLQNNIKSSKQANCSCLCFINEPAGVSERGSEGGAG